MKNSRWFSLNRFTSLRIAAAVTLLAAGCAIAIVATRAPEKQSRVAQTKGKPWRFGNEQAKPGSNETGPYAKAMEKYRINAYPAEDIPFDATQRAIDSWRAMEMRQQNAMALNPLNPYLNWKLVGPSVATFPPPLTFTGAQYITAGRTTAMAIDPACNATTCRLWIGAAGGGIWRTTNALASTPNWAFVSQTFGTNAIGTLVFDAANNTLYAGTGEGNASADSAAGVGVYKSTDGGDTWTLLPSIVTNITSTSPAGGGTFVANGTYTGNAFNGRAVGAIVIDPTNPNHLYVSTVRAVRGVASVSTGGSSNPPTPRPPFGLWESTDGGATFNFIWDGSDACPGATCDGTTPKANVRGVNHVELDKGWDGTTNRIVYASSFGLNGAVAGAGGIWRSADGGQTWVQIKSARNQAAGDNTDRCEFSLTQIAGPTTRMYVGCGNASNTAANLARVYRTDNAATAASDANFIDLTAAQDASAAPNQTLGYCSSNAAGAQCWYDNVIYTPPGKPDVVYVGGSYDYDQYGLRNQGRAFLRSTDAGVTFTDISWDANTSNPTPNPTCCQNLPFAQNGMHPDSQSMLEVPGTDIGIFGSDGGVVRNTGAFSDISATCTDASRGPLVGANLATCQQLLKAVPTQLLTMNVGLSTIQFQSVSVSPSNNTHVQGGTQDNGTFESRNSPSWPQVYYGDGGLSGFSTTDSKLRFWSNTGRSITANFRDGDPTQTVLIYIGIETSALFYSPHIADPQPLLRANDLPRREPVSGEPRTGAEIKPRSKRTVTSITAVTLAGLR